MIGCLSLARDTFDIELAIKKIAKTKKSIKKLSKNINFFEDLITNDEIWRNALKYFENRIYNKFIVRHNKNEESLQKSV